MGVKADLTGKRFAHLTVLKEGNGKDYGGHHYVSWICKCDCGKIVDVITGNLKSGNTKSCGCTNDGCRGKNKFSVSGNTVQVELSNGEIMLCDKDDWSKLGEYYWHKCKEGYARSNTREGRENSKPILFHHLIMPKKDGYVIDHINQNTLDNRKSNLRYATRSENAINSSKPKKSRTGIKGVYIIDDRKSKKYVATITVKGKTKWLGSFATAEEAEEARINEEVKLFGEFSPHY